MNRGAGVGIGVVGLGVGLLTFLADRLGWQPTSAELIVLIAVAVVLLVVGVWMELAAWVASRRPRLRPPEIAWRLDSAGDLHLQLRPGTPQVVVLEVILENPNPFNLYGVALDVVIPQGLCLGDCDMRGSAVEGGHRLTVQEKFPEEPWPPTPKDCWKQEGLVVPGNGNRTLCFKLVVTDPGSHYLKARLFGDSPQVESFATLEVVPGDVMTFGGMIGELIYQGERIKDGPESMFSDYIHQGAHGDFTVQLAFLAGMLPDDDRLWWHRANENVNPAGSGSLWRSRLASERVPLLYELRRRLDRPASTADELDAKHHQGSAPPAA